MKLKLKTPDDYIKQLKIAGRGDNVWVFGAIDAVNFSAKKARNIALNRTIPKYLTIRNKFNKKTFPIQYAKKKLLNATTGSIFSHMEEQELGKTVPKSELIPTNKARISGNYTKKVRNKYFKNKIKIIPSSAINKSSSRAKIGSVYNYMRKNKQDIFLLRTSREGAKYPGVFTIQNRPKYMTKLYNLGSGKTSLSAKPWLRDAIKKTNVVKVYLNLLKAELKGKEFGKEFVKKMRSYK